MSEVFEPLTILAKSLSILAPGNETANQGIPIIPQLIPNPKELTIIDGVPIDINANSLPFSGPMNGNMSVPVTQANGKLRDLILNYDFNLSGLSKFHIPLNRSVSATVNWSLTKNGNPVTFPDENVLNLGSADAPAYLFLPEFCELVSGFQPLKDVTTYKIIAKVTLAFDSVNNQVSRSYRSEEVILEIEVKVPKLAFPSLVALFMGENFGMDPEKGNTGCLISVPSNCPLTSLEMLNPVMVELNTILSKLAMFAKVAKWVFGLQTLSTVLQAATASKTITYVHGDVIREFQKIKVSKNPSFWPFGSDVTWDDKVCSVIALCGRSPNGRGISLFMNEGFKEDQGYIFMYPNASKENFYYPYPVSAITKLDAIFINGNPPPSWRHTPVGNETEFLPGACQTNQKQEGPKKYMRCMSSLKWHS